MMGEIYPDTGRLENRQWAFYADNVEIGHIPDPSENEGIEVHMVRPEELCEMINSGRFNHALHLCVIALAVSKNFFSFKCQNK